MPKKKKRRLKVQKIALRKCYFCENKKEPSLVEVSDLNRFLSEREKIIPRSRSGLCAKHQKKLGRTIKQARYLALLPFIARG